MDRQFKKGDPVWFTLVRKNYYKNYAPGTGSTEAKSTPHPVRVRALATFEQYWGEKQAIVTIDPRDGRSPIRRPVDLTQIELISEVITA